MHKPRIAVASRIFAPEPAAASFRLKALVQGLAAKGADVTVLTTKLPVQFANARVELPAGVNVKRFPALRDSTGYIKGYMQYMSFDIPLFFRILFGKKQDAVVCEPPPTTGLVTRVACGLRRVPYVYYAADIWSDAAAATAPTPVVSALRFVEKKALRGAKMVFATSGEVAARVRELGAKRVTVMENGADTSVFTPQGSCKDGRYFVYAGTASERHGAEVFAKAMRIVVKDHPDVKLVYVGSGSSDEEIQRIAEDLPAATIEQLGRVEAGEAAAWQRGAVAALASIKPGLGYDYAIATKVYSALACGTAVVYAGAGPLTEVIVEEKFGEAVAYDVQEVAQAMSRTLDQASVSGDAEHTAAEKLRRRQWVLDHHSLQATGKRAAQAVFGVLKR